MFLKLVFDDQVKKLAFHEGMKSYEGVCTLVENLKSWNRNEIDLKLKDTNDNVVDFNKDSDLHEFTAKNPETKFLVVQVTKTEPKLAKIPDNCETGFCDLSEIKEDQNRQHLGDLNLETGKSDQFFEEFRVGCFDAPQIIIENIEKKSKDENVGGNKSLLSECASVKDIFNPATDLDTSSLKYQGYIEMVSQGEIMEDEILEEIQKPSRKGLKIKRASKGDGEKLTKVRKEPTTKMRLKKIEEQLVESEQRTQSLVNEKFQSLNYKIDELTKNFATLSSPQVLTSTVSQKNEIVEKPTPSKVLCTTAHYGVCCNSCRMFPIVGRRYKCMTCSDYDLCEACEAQCMHNHPMIRLLSQQVPKIDNVNNSIEANRKLSEQKEPQYNDTETQEESKQMQETDNDDSEKQKMEFLDFMFGTTLTQFEKESLVKEYADVELAEFCAVAQTFTF